MTFSSVTSNAAGTVHTCNITGATGALTSNGDSPSGVTVVAKTALLDVQTQSIASIAFTGTGATAKIVVTTTVPMPTNWGTISVRIASTSNIRDSVGNTITAANKNATGSSASTLGPGRATQVSTGGNYYIDFENISGSLTPASGITGASLTVMGVPWPCVVTSTSSRLIFTPTTPIPNDLGQPYAEFVGCNLTDASGNRILDHYESAYVLLKATIILNELGDDLPFTYTFANNATNAAKNPPVGWARAYDVTWTTPPPAGPTRTERLRFKVDVSSAADVPGTGVFAGLPGWVARFGLIPGSLADAGERGAVIAMKYQASPFGSLAVVERLGYYPAQPADLFPVDQMGFFLNGDPAAFTINPVYNSSWVTGATTFSMVPVPTFPVTRVAVNGPWITIATSPTSGKVTLTDATGFTLHRARGSTSVTLAAADFTVINDRILAYDISKLGASYVLVTDTITLDYDGDGDIRDSAGAELAKFTGQAVANPSRTVSTGFSAAGGFGSF